MIGIDAIPRLIELSKEAGKAILEVYNSDDFDIELKEDDSPLTKADQRSNDIICDELRKRWPHIPIISEEEKSKPYAIRETYETCWLIDPLDGTKEFIKRNGEFTVNIALIENGNPILGIVHVPVSNVTYCALTGHGAYKHENGAITELRAKKFSIKEKDLKIVASRSHLNEGTQRLVDTLESPKLVSRGSSLKFMLLAEGSADFYPRLAPTMEWDTAAAQCVLNESGGQVLDFPNLNPLLYNKENLLNPFFLAMAQIKEDRDELLNFLMPTE